MQFNHQKMNDLSNKIKQLVNDSPLSELESNLNALIQGALTNMGLVSREEFDIQAALLARSQQQLAELEAKLSELERTMSKK